MAKIRSAIPCHSWHGCSDHILRLLPLAKLPTSQWNCLNSSVLIKLFPIPKPNLCCCIFNLLILSIWLAQKIKSLCASSMEIQKGNLSEWRKASLDPMLSKCLLDGLQAFDTHIESLQHPLSFTWIEFHPCETGCGIKIKAQSYDRDPSQSEVHQNS